MKTMTIDQAALIRYESKEALRSRARRFMHALAELPENEYPLVAFMGNDEVEWALRHHILSTMREADNDN